MEEQRFHICRLGFCYREEQSLEGRGLTSFFHGPFKIFNLSGISLMPFGRIQNGLVKVCSSSSLSVNCERLVIRHPIGFPRMETTLKLSRNRMSFLLVREGTLCPTRVGWLKRVRRETARFQHARPGVENMYSEVEPRSRFHPGSVFRSAPGCKSGVPCTYPFALEINR